MIVGDRKGKVTLPRAVTSPFMYGRSQRGARGYMFSRILGVALLGVVAQSRAATIKGTIVLDEVGGQPMANVQIVDSARSGGPWASGSDGGFTLDYPERHPGQRVQLLVNKEGYVVVNELQLDLAIPADPDARPLQIILCKEADREDGAALLPAQEF